VRRTVLIALIGMFLSVLGTAREAAAAGYHIFTSCEYGLGLVSGNVPNPNIYCELYWEQTAPPRVNHADWSGTVIYQPNPAIRDEFISPKFDMRTTAQPLAKWIRCSDVAGIFDMTIYAKSYEFERGSGATALYDFVMANDLGNVLATHRCTI
jgi:hypothetical protein